MKKFALVAPLCALVLAGCAHDPTIAGRVGGKAISIADVDLIAKVVCTSAAHSAPPVAVGLPTANQTAIDLLIQTELASKSAALTRVVLSQQEEQQLAQYVAGVQPLIGLLPAADRPRALELLTDNGRGQLEMEEIAARVLEGAGQQPTQDAVLGGAQRLTAAAARQFGVEVNPRFGSYNSSVQGSTSLSDAVSAVAKSAESSPNAAGSTAYVQGLPASQRCH